ALILPWLLYAPFLINGCWPYCAFPSLPTRRSSDLRSDTQIDSSNVQALRFARAKRAQTRYPKVEADSIQRCAAVGKTQLLGPHSDRKSTRLNSSHVKNSYAVFCLKKKTTDAQIRQG